MKPWRWRLTVVLGLLVLIFLLPSPVSRALRGGASQIFRPLLTVGEVSGRWLHGRLVNLRRLPGLYRENALLQQRIVDLEQQVTNLANAAQENEHLKKELGITNRPTANETVAATIIGRTTSDPAGEVLIDHGAHDQLQAGQAVVSQGVLVGRVEEVFKTTARLTLINSPRLVVQAKLTDSETLGLIQGGPTGLTLNEVDQGVTVREGEIVQTSGLGGMIPSGLIIGQVDHLTTGANAAKQQAVVRSPLDLDQLRLVFIILQTAPDS